jgi:hypothetical protein
MSHGYAGEGQHFYLGWALADVPQDFSFLRALTDDAGEFAIVKRYGMDVCCAAGDALRASATARRALVVALRRDYWWIRNQRWNGVKPQALRECEERVLDTCCWLELGGVAPRDILMVAQCHQHRCVCDECDCLGGERVGRDRPTGT